MLAPVWDRERDLERARGEVRLLLRLSRRWEVSRLELLLAPPACFSLSLRITNGSATRPRLVSISGTGDFAEGGSDDGRREGDDAREARLAARRERWDDMF